MYLENVVMDAVVPQRLGRFWEAALAAERLTDEPEGFETRLTVQGGPVLDLCFQRVPDPLPAARAPGPRLHLDLAPGADQAEVVTRLLALGARPADIGRRDVPWVVLADPEGNPFRVLEPRPGHATTGPLAALPLLCADPDEAAAFWAWLTGWTEVAGDAPRSLRHPSLRGPFLDLCPQREPKAAAKNRIHLDVRLEPGDEGDEVAAQVAARGGRELHPQWGDLSWRVFQDPSGNEFCVLQSRG